MLRTLLLSLVVLALGACGFQLRQEVALPAEFARMRVETVDPFSPLGRGFLTGRFRSIDDLEPNEKASGLIAKAPVHTPVLSRPSVCRSSSDRREASRR